MACVVLTEDTAQEGEAPWTWWESSWPDRCPVGQSDGQNSQGCCDGQSVDLSESGLHTSEEINHGDAFNKIQKKKEDDYNRIIIFVETFIHIFSSPWC